jgi:hypothetical protein
MRPNNSLLATVLVSSVISFAAGCAHDKHEAIPATAMLGAEGERRLTYTTSRAGTIFVQDTTDNSLVYSGEVNGPRQITVDPEKNEITVDGTLVQDKKLTKGHNHRIMFEPLVVRDRY